MVTKSLQRRENTSSIHAEFAQEEAVIFGTNVERLRLKQKLDVAKFAQMAGVSRPTIYKIERGECDARLSLVRKIADALGVTVQDLLRLP